jgi:Secretion system C-terminal sorting domain
VVPYTESASPIVIAPGDSAFVVLPEIALDAYSGNYDLTYSITSATPEDLENDNTFRTNILFSDLFAYAPTDTASGQPISTNFVRASDAGANEEFENCIALRDANASRLTASGIIFAASSSTGTELTGQVVDVRLYQWNDAFDDLNDPAFPSNGEWDLDLLAEGTYEYEDNLQDQAIYVAFEGAIVELESDLRYLACAVTANEDVFFGYNQKVDYDENLANVDYGNFQPSTVVGIEGDWNEVGFGTDNVSAVALVTSGVAAVVEQERLEVTPYPNPTTTSMVSIPFAGVQGAADLRITDATGKVVRQQQVVLSGRLDVSLAGLSNGTYLFHVQLKDGRTSDFRVVVNK